MNKNNKVILTDKYYIIQESICKWYITDDPKGKTPYSYKADSWDIKELAADWILKSVANPDGYEVIEVEMTFKEV